MNPETLAGFGLIAVPIFLSLTLHEYAHARVALAFGDRTAQLMGRVTINPLAHLDLLGTICLFFGPIGWAKPVPVNPMNLHPRRLGDLCVSLAGVGMNLLLAGAAIAAIHVLAAANVRIDPEGSATVGSVSVFMLILLMYVNTGILLFNLIPLYPLDGHHVLREMIGPWRMQDKFMEFQLRYGRILLLLLIGIPWVMRQLGHVEVFDPIGWVFGYVVRFEREYLFSDQARNLAAEAWNRHFRLLPWYR